MIEKARVYFSFKQTPMVVKVGVYFSVSKLQWNGSGGWSLLLSSNGREGWYLLHSEQTPNSWYLLLVS